MLTIFIQLFDTSLNRVNMFLDNFPPTRIIPTRFEVKPDILQKFLQRLGVNFKRRKIFKWRAITSIENILR